MGLPVAGSASTLGAVGTRAQALRRPIPRRNTPHFVSIASLLLTRSGASGLTAAPHSCPSRRHAIWGSVHTASAVYHHRESHKINLCKVNRLPVIRSSGQGTSSLYGWVGERRPWGSTMYLHK